MARSKIETLSRDTWWGDAAVDENTSAHWQVGAYEFWLTRNASEWRFVARTDDESPDSTVQTCENPFLSSVPEAGVEIRRLGFQRTASPLRITPFLADRPMIIRTAQPIALPPREELTLYFSSPLWLNVEVGEPLVSFLEIPLQRPSDTWFGPNTRTGELCYALRTSARLQLSDVPLRPHRALTELHIVNSAAEMLNIERIQVPMPMMSLFETSDHQLWTQTVTFERRERGTDAELNIGKNPPAHARNTKLLAPPRIESHRGNIFQAFGGLIGGR